MRSHNATIVLTNKVVLDDQQPTALSNVTFGHRYMFLGVIHGTGEGLTLAEWQPGEQASLPITFQTGFLARGGFCSAR